MTIRTRLTIWYAAIFSISLLIIGISMYFELVVEQRDKMAKHGGDLVDDDAGLDITQIIVFYGGTAVVVGVLGGWWLTRRALAPVVALTDATEKITAQNLGERLTRTNNGDELDRLTEVFNSMLARLDDSFNRIREFTLHASHELKTPLTVLRGETETALRDDSLSVAERDRAVSQLDELRRLTHIVDGLTLLAKADAGQVKLNLETVRLDELVRDNFADLQILAEPQGIKVALETCEEISVRGDRHRLRQLLLNLADNAVKYNKPKGIVTMNLRGEGESAKFFITNTGAGIPPEVLPRVFDRFFRGDAAHGDAVEGCGLGLSIAQWIASAHGGKIQISSAPAQSTIVTLQLPIA
ncbi:MAG TPA: ATP-binding protein [Verrucomicrobiae bacterium]|nr:ATP-binding protein [Verrucomicrobiae bacterium]